VTFLQNHPARASEETAFNLQRHYFDVRGFAHFWSDRVRNSDQKKDDKTDKTSRGKDDE